ncbi:hypothetical protein GCK32_014063, partial [Trichostrongylus colubriformis]
MMMSFATGFLGKLTRALPNQHEVRRAPSSPKPQATPKPMTAGSGMREVKIGLLNDGTNNSCTGNSSCACGPSGTWFNNTCIPLLNECSDKTLNDCDPEATCMDNPLSYECLCRENFLDVSPDPVKKPGRKCIKSLLNECSDKTLNDCDPEATCMDNPLSYECLCRENFLDVSPDPVKKPGRKCIKLSIECVGCNSSTSHCVPTAGGNVVCACRPGYEDLDPINPGQNCSKLTQQPGYFQCRCPKGFVDVSPDKRTPGRKCVRADVCMNMDCAPEAECRETPMGPMCQCMSGFVDVSRQHGRPAGRICRAVVNECAEGKHDCSRHAACIDTADGFTCRCHDNYRDESPSPSTLPGRVCVFVQGTYKCRCASGYSRLPDGRCLAINECEHQRLNTCGQNAECIDL